ncbi:MAG: transglutaminase domain-containing protein, partial [Melioribacteraceae bacterium]|nr:transglutaminase domain-containing protein [Melioribacteraceae bacterium]
QTKSGDCESGATLLYAMCRYHRINPMQLKLVTGTVKIGDKLGGHCWVEYCPDETADPITGQGKWVILDWCYYFDSTPFNLRRSATDDERYVKRWWFVTDLE